MAETAPILTGLKVLDLASFIAGPAAATILGDFGAEVIKIEPPTGDPYRGLSSLPGMPNSKTPYHWQLDNRNKRGLVLDLKTDAGREVLDRLLPETDVLVCNFMPAVRQRLRLAYEDVVALNPRLIYAVITGYGETGEEADKPGFDSSALWARSGLMDFVKPDPVGVPARSAPGQGDHPTAVSLFAAIMLALYQRQCTGRGMQVDTSLLANGLWSNGYLAQAALCGADVPTRPKRNIFPNALTNHYQCRGGHWFILSMVNEDREWQRFCQAIERPELFADPRFREKPVRHDNSHPLIEILDGVFGEKEWPVWRDILDRHRITFASVAHMADLKVDRQLLASGTVVPCDSLGGDGEHTIDSPLWTRGAQKQPAGKAPALGEHSAAILQELGYGEAHIDALRRDGVIGD